MINHKVDKYSLHDVFLHLSFHWFIYWLHNSSGGIRAGILFQLFHKISFIFIFRSKIVFRYNFCIWNMFFRICLYFLFCLLSKSMHTNHILFQWQIWIQTLSWTTQIMLDRRQKPQCCFVNTTINDRIERTIISMVWMKILGG